MVDSLPSCELIKLCSLASRNLCSQQRLAPDLGVVSAKGIAYVLCTCAFLELHLDMSKALPRRELYK